MLTVRIGKTNMVKHKSRRRVYECVLMAVPTFIFIILFVHKYIHPFTGERTRDVSFRDLRSPFDPLAGLCISDRNCPKEHFSFYIQSGAMDAVAPRICVENDLVLGRTGKNYAAYGLNTVILNGKTGDVMKTDHVSMDGSDVQPLIKLLTNIENGSVVLMASFEGPSWRLTHHARTLIAGLGSASSQALGFRDAWVFVTNGAATLNFEKFMSKEHEDPASEEWAELVELQGCVRKTLEDPK
ncbi:protein FAM3C-like [Aulostomus maculatus]